ncbi:MAG: N-acyl homoserine lactonase family protein [Acetobacteraceae bacterium]
MSPPEYEVFALRYATLTARTAGENFLFPDDHASAMPIDYYLWAIRGAGRTIVVDTGFSPESGVSRGRQFLHSPEEALRAIGIDAAKVRDVVISHLHWDHAGNWEIFPAATFHLQDSEMAFATGRCMCHDVFRRALEVEDVVGAVRNVFAGRIRFHDGTAEIAPGVTLHLIGGHSGGQQSVRVRTRRGWVVLASDATHFWANIRTRNPFPLVVDVARMLEGYQILEALADGPDHIIPGHDPLVLKRFPTVPGHPDIARVDERPVDERPVDEPPVV